jgi:hypothetical protein
MLEEVCLMAEFFPIMNSVLLNVQFVITEVPEKRLALHIFYQSKVRRVLSIWRPIRPSELGRVNDLAFNTPANNRIQIVHYLQAELKKNLVSVCPSVPATGFIV